MKPRYDRQVTQAPILSSNSNLEIVFLTGSRLDTLQCERNLMFWRAYPIQNASANQGLKLVPKTVFWCWQVGGGDFELGNRASYKIFSNGSSFESPSRKLPNRSK